MRRFLPGLLTGILVAATARGEENWPQFGGPRGDGSSRASRLPLAWSETNNIAWKVSLPGRGRSSPVVLGERIWLTTAIEQGVQRTRIGSDDMQTAEHVSLESVCLDGSDGRIIWSVRLFEVDKPDPVHWLNSWATPTPVVESGRLYCDFGTFGTACLEASTGQVLWRERLPVDHQVGPGSSPVLYQNLLVLVRDGRDAQYVAALDKETGRVVWRMNRPPLEAASGNLKKSFSTPLVVRRGDRAQLISPGAHWVVSYDPATGQEIWRLRHGHGFSIGSCPVYGHGLVFFGTGCFKAELWAVGVDEQGEVPGAHAAWKTIRQVPVMSSPVLAGEELYWISDDGMACCADARTGEVHWQERLGGSYLASPLHGEGRLYFFNLEAKTTVLEAGRQVTRLAENLLEGTLVATPALVDGAMFLRTDARLYRIGKAKDPPMVR